jgi:hypothetical protein
MFVDGSRDSVSVERKVWSAEGSSFPALARGLLLPDRVLL